MFTDTPPAAVRAVESSIAAAWPETAADGHGIWEDTESGRVATDQMGLPRAVIKFLPAQIWEHSPMTQIIYEQPVQVYYGATTAEGDTKPFRSKVKDYQNALLTGGLVDPETGQRFALLPARFSTHVSAGDEAQVPMLLHNNFTQVGCLEFAMLVGDDSRR